MFKLKTKWLNKWANKNNVSDKNLLEAINNLEAGLSTVSLGSGLFKVRVAINSGGIRTIIVYKQNDRAVIVYGFAKNEKDNLSKPELLALKALSKDILKQNRESLELAIKNNIFIPIKESKWEIQ